MFRIRKSDIHPDNKQQESARPRQLGGVLQANTGHTNSKIGDDTNLQRRHGAESGSSVPSKTERAQKKPLAGGHFGRVADAKTAQDIARWYWETYQLVITPALLGQKHPMGEWADIETIDDVYWGENGGFKTDEINYACLTGPSRVTVIDFDNREGAKEYPLDTFTVETPRGLHYYLRLPEQVPNSVNQEQKIDVRSQGGVAILPPSLGQNATLYRLTNDSPILEMSMDAFDSYCAALGIKRNKEGFRNEPGWFAEAWGLGAEIGERNNTCAKLSGYLIGKGLTPSEVSSIMVLWGREMCNPPMNLNEIEQTVKSIARKHERDGPKITTDFDEELSAARADPSNPFAG